MMGDERDFVLDEVRSLVAEESRLRRELGISPGPTFYELCAMTGDQLWLEVTKLRMELGRPADDGPGSGS
jgi:hypothetical protein